MPFQRLQTSVLGQQKCQETICVLHRGCLGGEKSAIGSLVAVDTVLARDIKKLNSVQGHRIRENRREVITERVEDERIH